MTAEKSRMDNRQVKSDEESGNKPKRKRGRPRKKSQTSVDKEPTSPQKKLTKKEKEGLAILSEKTREAQVMRFLLAGYGKEEIADELEVSISTIKTTITNAAAKIDAQGQQIREQWRNVSLARTEILMKKLMLRITDEEYDLEQKDVNMMQKLLKMQGDLLGEQNGSGPTIQNNVFVPQMDSTSPAYQYSLAQMQHESTGKVMNGLEDMVVLPDSEVSKLDGLLED